MGDSDEPSCSATDGVMLQLRGNRGSGAALQGDWKCWTPVASQSLKWELRRLLPSLGYDLTKTHGRVCDRVRDMKWRWIGLLNHMSFQVVSEHFGESAHALQQRTDVPRHVLDHAEQEFWVSTPMLVLVLLDVRCSAHSAIRCEAAELLLVMLCERCVDAEFLENSALLGLPDDVADKCAEDVVDTFCACWRSARNSIRALTEGIPQRQLARILMAMYDQLACASTSAWLASTLRKVGKHIDERVQVWGKFDWHKTSVAAIVNRSTGRHLRVDFHAKQFVLRRTLEQGQASTPSQAARCMDGITPSQVVHWIRREMADFQATSHICFNGAEDVALVYDAARIGQPAKEMCCGMLRNLRSKENIGLPPQVHYS
jgi:hypothetical protein